MTIADLIRVLQSISDHSIEVVLEDANGEKYSISQIRIDWASVIDWDKKVELLQETKTLPGVMVIR